MGKKLGLAIVGILIVGIIYYITAGSSQLTEQMKAQVDTALTSLQKEGFSIQERDVKERKEHFILSFDEPAKMAQFFTHKGLQLNVNDAALLKGTKLGVDVAYLPDTYAAVSLDVYPLAFPETILAMAENDKEKKVFQQLLDKKTFLAHIAINKLGNGFKGYMKDINEVLQGEQKVTLEMKGLNFWGDLKAQRISTVKETLERLSFAVDDDISFSFNGIKSDYHHTGETAYDYTTNYNIDKINLRSKKGFTLIADTLAMQSISTVKNGLASGSMKSTAKHISTEEKNKKYIFDTFALEMKADNLDVTAFEKLQHIDVNNQQEVNALMQQLISKGVHFEIPTFSIANIINKDKKLGGFDFSAKVNIDKTLNIATSQANPLAALSAIDANVNITLSRELFGIIAQQPQAIMALMLFQPKDVNGQKVYTLELKDGKLTVNDTPVN